MRPYEAHNAKLREDRELGRMGISNGTWANQQGLYEFKRNNQPPAPPPQPWRAPPQIYWRDQHPSTSWQAPGSGSDDKPEGDSGWGGAIIIILIVLMIV